MKRSLRLLSHLYTKSGRSFITCESSGSDFRMCQYFLKIGRIVCKSGEWQVERIGFWVDLFLVGWDESYLPREECFYQSLFSIVWLTANQYNIAENWWTIQRLHCWYIDWRLAAWCVSKQFCIKYSHVTMHRTDYSHHPSDGKDHTADLSTVNNNSFLVSLSLV